MGDTQGERKPLAATDRLPLRTPAAAAQLLAVPESWLRRKAAARVIPCTFLGRHLRFSPADLVAIAAAGAQQASPRSRPRSPPGPSASITRAYPTAAHPAVDPCVHRACFCPCDVLPLLAGLALALRAEPSVHTHQQ